MVRCIDCKHSIFSPDYRSGYKCEVTAKAIDDTSKQRLCDNFEWKVRAPYIT